MPAWKGMTNFLTTWTLTFCISTFWLNSGGNLVDFMSRASPPEAMMGKRSLGDPVRAISEGVGRAVWRADSDGSR